MKAGIKILFVLLCCVSILSLGSTGYCAKKVVKLRYGTAAFPSLPTYDVPVKFAEMIKERTNGRYLIEPIQERKLGADRDLIEFVTAGALEMAHASTAVFDGFFPDLNALQLPFLIRDYETLKKVYLADYTAELCSVVDKLNMHSLGLSENGFRHIGNNVRSINTPADLKGIKIRVAETKMHQEIFSGLGGIPIPISYGEIYTSLKTGVINGTEINATSSASEKLMEVIKYFSMTGHFFWPSVTFVNKGFWNSMTPEDQKIFEEAFRELIPWQVDLCVERDKKALETMKKRGIVINQADQKAFFDQSKFVYDKYMKTPAVEKFVNKVQAIK